VVILHINGGIYLLLWGSLESQKIGIG